MPRILIMVAMEEEAQYLRPLIGGVSEERPMRGVVGDVCTRGKIGGTHVDIVISGIGAVHAASATTAALLAGPCDAVISCGCSGAHVIGQKMGDLVLGSSVSPLDPVVIARDGSKRYSGVRYSMTTKGTTEFRADKNLLSLAKAAAEEVRKDQPTMRIDVGTVGSGDAWRQSPSVIHEVHKEMNTLCEEMEAHAVAQVCEKFGVPFLAVKDIANSELDPEAVQLEPTHHVVPPTVKVGYNAALVTAGTVRLLAEAGRTPPSTPSRKRSASTPSVAGELPARSRRARLAA